AEDFVNMLGKQVVRSGDRAGFVVNALIIPYLLGAIRMVEAGHATVSDVDRAVVLGCAHPMGPLRLADLIGLDTLHAIATAMYDELRDPGLVPPPLLTQMVDAGLLGGKAGRGFHVHPGPDPTAAPRLRREAGLWADGRDDSTFVIAAPDPRTRGDPAARSGVRLTERSPEAGVAAPSWAEAHVNVRNEVPA
ncbi:3-hydroxyacyl-CoA dehydrogenase family protein, partial [Frankia sp. AvcI1]|uniref:3-hydroxyacyl-CoA dehydrogenase family protein n=1 Tax=Frankia sp. AvcI1 TaxID=573496 RepID=UPI0028C453D9